MHYTQQEHIISYTTGADVTQNIFCFLMLAFKLLKVFLDTVCSNKSLTLRLLLNLFTLHVAVNIHRKYIPMNYILFLFVKLILDPESSEDKLWLCFSCLLGK